jgi:hypothetical protein
VTGGDYSGLSQSYTRAYRDYMRLTIDQLVVEAQAHNMVPLRITSTTKAHLADALACKVSTPGPEDMRLDMDSRLWVSTDDGKTGWLLDEGWSDETSDKIPANRWP